MPLLIDIRDGIALVTLDNPPVNALGQAMRQALDQAVDRLGADPAVRAVVLAGAGALFVGGADITEFDRPPAPPHLPQVLERIERQAKPWIAALHGQALGGGLELALACHYRLAAAGTRLSLPEVTLGIIPGGGGTQRLPRLIGVAAAIPVVAETRALAADEALKLGLVDALLPEGPVLEAALDFARRAADLPLPLPARDRPAADPGAEVWDAAKARIAKSARGVSAPLQALAVLRLGVEQGVEAGLAEERATFLHLRQGEESAALRHLFFAERAALRPADLRGTAPRPVARVGVVGGGTMGVGIAAALRNAGYPVTLSERDEASLARATTALQGIFDAAQRRGSLTEAEAQARMAGVAPVTGIAALADCDLVIEAVFEDLDTKRQVFADLARHCRPDAVLATNTSYMDPRSIVAGLPGPERYIGLHFFSPAQVMKLLEIIPLPDTSDTVRATAWDLARRLGKIPVRSGICDGFIGNRILRHYRTAAEALLRDGIGHAAIDAAMRGFGLAMGPFEMQDLAGLDISFLNREAARARGEDVPETPGDLLVRAGRKGQKTGGGWYDYAPGDRTPRPSDAVARLIAPLCAPPRNLPGPEIARQLVAAMAAEGQRILDEGIAASAADIDLVEVHGYGFPRAKGGPMFLAARAGQGA